MLEEEEKKSSLIPRLSEKKKKKTTTWRERGEVEGSPWGASLLNSSNTTTAKSSIVIPSHTIFYGDLWRSMSFSFPLTTQPRRQSWRMEIPIFGQITDYYFRKDGGHVDGLCFLFPDRDLGSLLFNLSG